MEPSAAERPPKQLYPLQQSDELKGLLAYDQLGSGNPGAWAWSCAARAPRSKLAPQAPCARLASGCGRWCARTASPLESTTLTTQVSQLTRRSQSRSQSQTLTFPPANSILRLTSNRPNTDAANARISLNYGGFTWTPTQAQVVTFTVTATSLVNTLPNEHELHRERHQCRPACGRGCDRHHPAPDRRRGDFAHFYQHCARYRQSQQPAGVQPPEPARRGEHRQQQPDERGFHLDAHRGPGGHSLLHHPRGGYRAEHLGQQLPGFPGDRHPDQ